MSLSPLAEINNKYCSSSLDFEQQYSIIMDKIKYLSKETKIIFEDTIVSKQILDALTKDNYDVEVSYFYNNTNGCVNHGSILKISRPYSRASLYGNFHTSLYNFSKKRFWDFYYDM